MIRIFILAALLMQAAAAPAAPTDMFDAASAVARQSGFRGFLLVGEGSGFREGEIGTPGGATGGAKTVATWRWASVSKQIVATAVMQQVHAGKVDLDTPIARYAPRLKVANADRITLRQLLQHTSGLPNVEDGPLDPNRPMLVQFLRTSPRPAPGVSAICRGPAKAEPGARFEYNDCDTEVVGAVLEEVTWQRLGRLLSQRIFAPSGMVSARLLAPGDAAGRRGYLADGRNDDFIDVGRFGAAGAVAGNPHDLFLFDRALMTDALLPRALRDTMWEGAPKLGFAALGQWSYTVPLKGCAKPVALVERRGSIGGVEIRNVIAPELDKVVIAFDDHGIDYGEPWQGRGLTYDLLSAAFCPA